MRYEPRLDPPRVHDRSLLVAYPLIVAWMVAELPFALTWAVREKGRSLRADRTAIATDLALTLQDLDHTIASEHTSTRERETAKANRKRLENVIAQLGLTDDRFIQQAHTTSRTPSQAGPPVTDGGVDRPRVDWQADYDEPVRPRDLPPLDAECEYVDGQPAAEILDELAAEGDQRGLKVRCWQRGEGEWWWYILPVGDDLYAAFNPDEQAAEWGDRAYLRQFLRRHGAEESAVQDVATVPVKWMPLWGDGALHVEVMT